MMNDLFDALLIFSDNKTRQGVYRRVITIQRASLYKDDIRMMRERDLNIKRQFKIAL